MSYTQVKLRPFVLPSSPCGKWPESLSERNIISDLQQPGRQPVPKGSPMSDVSRVCSQCGGKVAIDSRFCGRCGYDTTAGLPIEQRNLPAQIASAALPVAAGLAGWAVRAGWKLLRNRLEEMTKNPPAVSASRPAPAPRRANPDKKERLRSVEHTSELQSHSFISYAVFCLKKKTTTEYEMRTCSIPMTK